MRRTWVAVTLCGMLVIAAVLVGHGLLSSPVTAPAESGPKPSPNPSEVAAAGAASASSARRVDDSSLQRLETLANEGQADAAQLLGLRYASGDAGERDDEKALHWFMVAARAGSAQAQFNVALMAARGRGTRKDLAQAARWYKLAATQGLAAAQFNLANMLASGRGIARDDAAAAHWYEQAATQGVAEAEYNLGKMYQTGRGVVKSDARARLAFRRAYDLGLTRALKELSALGEKPEPSASLPLRASVEADPMQRAVLNLDERRFTIQVVSYATREKAVAFVEKYDLGNTVGVYRSWKQGGYFFSVVAGEYQTYDQARQEGVKLAQRLRLNGLEPWARAVARVQTEALEQAPPDPPDPPDPPRPR